MTVNKFKKEIIIRLEKRDIEVNVINVKGFKNNHVESVRVSVGSYGGENVLDAIKDALDEIEIDFGVGVNTRLVEF